MPATSPAVAVCVAGASSDGVVEEAAEAEAIAEATDIETAG